MKPDFTYRDDGTWSLIMPETPQAHQVWNESLAECGGFVLSIHFPQVREQLRAAGYSIHKARPVEATDAELLAALEA